MLVTGGTGIIGRQLCARLHAQGAQVTTTSSRPPVYVPPVDGARLVFLPLTDPDAVGALVDSCRPEVVIHLASAVSASRALHALLPTFDKNLTSTVTLLDALLRRALDVRFVHAGSLEEPEPGDAPSSPYAASKAAATAYVRMAHELYGLAACVARIFMVYGPGDRATGRLVPYVIRSLLAGDAPALSSGAREIDWVYVDDIVEGLVRLAVAAAGPAAGRTVDLGTGTLTSVRGVAERLVAITGARVAPAYGALADRPHEQVRVADIAATRELLGWTPQITLDDGLARTVAWFRAG